MNLIDGPRPAFDGEDLRAVMGRCVTTVSVITTLGRDGVPEGMTCNSVTSVCLSPALVLFCGRGQSRSVQAVLNSGLVGINVLGEKSARLAVHFARPGPAKFGQISWAPTRSGVPQLLEGCIAFLEGHVEESHTFGDHQVIVSRIRAGKLMMGEPLLHSGRSYWHRPQRLGLDLETTP